MSDLAPYTSLQIVIPVYNDWESVHKPLPLVDEQLQDACVDADRLKNPAGRDTRRKRTLW